MVLARTSEPSLEAQEAPWEFVIPGVSSATASPCRARAIRSSVGRAAGEGSCIARSRSSGGTTSSGSPAAASSPVTRAIPTVSSTRRWRAGREKSDV